MKIFNLKLVKIRLCYWLLLNSQIFESSELFAIIIVKHIFINYYMNQETNFILQICSSFGIIILLNCFFFFFWQLRPCMSYILVTLIPPSSPLLTQHLPLSYHQVSPQLFPFLFCFCCFFVTQWILSGLLSQAWVRSYSLEHLYITGGYIIADKDFFPQGILYCH